MDPLHLHGRAVSAIIDLHDDTVTLFRNDRRLPWSIDLGASASMTVRDLQAAAGERQVALRLAELTLNRLGPTRLQWLGELGGAGVALEIGLEGDALHFAISPTGAGAAEIVRATWPGEVRFTGPAREVCFAPYQQGALFRNDGKPWAGETRWNSACCRVYGFTCGRDSLAAIVETPYDAVARFADDGAKTMKGVLEWGAALGALRYRRRVGFLPLAETGHVAVATAFRAYAQCHDLWISWAERVAANPAVARLKGAFIADAGYFFDAGADQVSAMRSMKRLGFDRGYLFSPKLFTFGESWAPGGAEYNRLTDAQVADIQALGYVCAPFLQVEESHESLGLDKFARDATDKPLLRWQIGDRRYYEIAKWRVPAMLPTLDGPLQESQAVHFDTLAAMSFEENYGTGPYDRAGDASYRREIAQYYRRRGKIVAAEGLRDAMTPLTDLATSKWFPPVYPWCRRLWTVPLADLVYHDSLIRCHWEHTAYDDRRCIHSNLERSMHPWAQVLSDLLTASPPVLFPEGMLYEFDHETYRTDEGYEEIRPVMSAARLYRKRFTDPETQAVLPAALRVCRLNARHGTARLIAHRFLEADSPLVQETEFASGLRVIANYGEEPYPLPGRKMVPPHDALTEE